MLRRNIQLLFGMLRLFKELFWNGNRLKIHGFMYYISRGVRFNTEKDNHSFIDLGKKTWVGLNNYFSASGGQLRLGYNNFFNSNVNIISKKSIRIGNNNLFGPNVVIVDHDHRFDDRLQLICKQGYVSEAIEIGSDIWIGANVIICKGVTICDHVVVAGNSVVSKSIFESGVYAGIPARKIKDI